MGGAEPRPYSPQESTPHSLQCVIAKPVRTLAVAIRLLRPLRRGITDSHVASLLGMTGEVFVRHSKTAASGGSGGFALLGEGEECMEKKSMNDYLLRAARDTMPTIASIPAKGAKIIFRNIHLTSLFDLFFVSLLVDFILAET